MAVCRARQQDAGDAGLILTLDEWLLGPRPLELERPAPRRASRAGRTKSNSSHRISRGLRSSARSFPARATAAATRRDACCANAGTSRANCGRPATCAGISCSSSRAAASIASSCRRAKSKPLRDALATFSAAYQPSNDAGLAVQAAAPLIPAAASFRASCGLKGCRAGVSEDPAGCDPLLPGFPASRSRAPACAAGAGPAVR